MIQITQENASGWCVMKVSGRADAVTAAQLEDRLCKAVQSDAKVAADFSQVIYISSAGIRAVLQAARAAQKKKVEFAVCAPSAAVRQVFEISGLQNILTILGELPC